MPNIADGNQSFLLGQNASRDPDQIPAESYAAGINLNIQRGVLSPRWGFSQLPLQFETDLLLLPNFQYRSYETIFRSGRFQALIPYVVGNTFYLIVVISGVIFSINLETNDVFVISIDDGSMLDEGSPRLNWSAAGKFLVIFDYPAYPVIIEGFQARRADPAASEIPISVLGTYNQNRLFISNAGNEYTGGDPSGSLAAPDAPISFLEVLVPAAPFFGQIFQLPTAYNNNQITAMTFLQATDSSTGIGPLIIGTAKEIYAAGTQLPRTDWESSTFASNIVFNTGIAGQRAFTNVNSDLFFFSPDGEVRSLSMSRDEQRKWSKVPMSREVQNWLKFNDRSLTAFAAMGYFKNKLFATANPTRVSALSSNGTPIIDVCHGGLVVLEMDTISTSTESSPPAWAGLWTGVRPMDICNNNERCFIISKDPAYTNQIYEVTPDRSYDLIAGRVRKIRSRVYSRAYPFDGQYSLKEINSIDFNLSKVKGEFELEVAYKPEQSERYLPWRKFTHEAPWRACGMPQGCQYNGFAAHNFRELPLGSPSTAGFCNDVTRDNYSLFRTMQVRLDITGIDWEIKGFMIGANVKPQSTTDTVCGPYPVVAVCEPCNDDWDFPKESLCPPQQ